MANSKYPRGYRREDEKGFRDFLEDGSLDGKEVDKLQIPKDSIIKFHNGTLAELKDPIRRNEKVINKEEGALDLQIDLYLFGKGIDIDK